MLVARAPAGVESTVENRDPYRLIADTAHQTCWRRRLDALLPGLPPLVASLVALLAGRLPVELGVAALVALAVLLLYVASVEVSLPTAAAFLDRTMSAKEHFLTLATLQDGTNLRPVVEAGAIAIARLAPEPSLPPRRKRPLAASVLLSAAGLLLLWLLPEVASVAATGDPLDRIAAELARSPEAADRALAVELSGLAQALRDPRLSSEEKLARVKESIAKLDRAERERLRRSTAASSGGEGEKGDEGRQAKAGGQSKAEGAGDHPGAQGEDQGGQQAAAGDARGRARQELTKLAGELSAEQPGSAEQEAKKSQAEGGGIQGPQGEAKERGAGAEETAGNQPGKIPDKPGGDQKPGGQHGESKTQAASHTPDQAQGQSPIGAAGSAAEGAGQRSSVGPDRNAERYYKPGEGPDGRIIDGRYVRIRVPQDSHHLPGTEEVVKPGDIAPEVGYGNAPLPEAGPPGRISTEQPVPLEYRGALGSAGR